MSKNVALMEFESNPNIGLYMFANDKFCIIGKNLENKKKEIEKILKVPVYCLKALGTDLIGIFISGNNDYLLIPKMYTYELEEFNKIAEKEKIKLIISKDILNTFGNNTSFIDKKIIISTKYKKKFYDELKNKTNLKIIRIETKEYEAIGSICKSIKNKFFVSQELNENELKEILDDIAGIGTINSGSPYISSGVVGNINGVIIGSSSSSIEIQNILETLDYL
jgi:translation initiation factor 6 (eIF-6)